MLPAEGRRRGHDARRTLCVAMRAPLRGRGCWPVCHEQSCCSQSQLLRHRGHLRHVREKRLSRLRREALEEAFGLAGERCRLEACHRLQQQGGGGYVGGHHQPHVATRRDRSYMEMVGRRALADILNVPARRPDPRASASRACGSGEIPACPHAACPAIHPLTHARVARRRSLGKQLRLTVPATTTARRRRRRRRRTALKRARMPHCHPSTSMRSAGALRRAS